MLERFTPKDVIAMIGIVLGCAYCLIYKVDPTTCGYLTLFTGYVLGSHMALKRNGNGNGK